MRYGPRLRPLRDQVMLITGASSGIGLVTARAAAEEGARVVLVARNGDALAAICAEIEAKGGQATHAVADVGDAARLRQAARHAIERFGRIDTWVNCAGVAIYGKLLDTPLDEHERLFRTDYFGVVNGATIAVEHMRDRGGALITVGSIVSDIPTPVLGAYAAAKHAAKGFIESLRLEIIADRLPISVSLIKPAGIDTPIARHSANHGAGEARIPPPPYDPHLVARAILHAAQHPRRTITVGGVGRAQVLVGTHFPRLLEAVTSLMRRLLIDESGEPARQNNLHAPAQDGEAQSGRERTRRTSLYTSAALHPRVVGIAGATILAGLLLAQRRKRRAIRQKPTS